ncbi:hypothetical protein [Aestuariivirga litoralis]|uniref:hypothetical protein n=1 Tax=Aestuariivirga litoralis TaxID=2650924 RepID=UPI0032B22F02
MAFAYHRYCFRYEGMCGKRFQREAQHGLSANQLILLGYLSASAQARACRDNHGHDFHVIGNRRFRCESNWAIHYGLGKSQKELDFGLWIRNLIKY